MTSCESVNSLELQPLDYSIDQTSEPYIKLNLESAFNEQQISVLEDEFDFSKTKVIETELSENSAIIVPSRKDPNLNLSATLIEGKLFAPLRIRMIVSDDGSKILEYRTMDESYGLKLFLNSDNILIDKAFDETLMKGIWGNLWDDVVDCGNSTLDCMGEAYTESGWASVVLTVATAYLPSIAAASAIVCAGISC